MNDLLSREQFRTSVFSRDQYCCVICHEPAQDAHHIMERRLFPDEGYYLDNGVSLCGKHHIEAEQTLLSCEDLRSAAGITRIVLPPHLYSDEVYDKWGNIILPNGQRLQGELFSDLSVQKILSPVLSLFTPYVKYPRTYHLPWSPGMTDDDRMMPNTLAFEGQEVVVTEKMDGENTSLYRDYIHARSLEYSSRIDRDWIKAFHARMGYNIPEGWRICGENLWGKHSIAYDDLETFFMVHSIWNGPVCFSWNETLEWCALLDLKTVPLLFRGIFDRKQLPSFFSEENEGYVIRLASSFHLRHYPRAVGKYVRKDHVKTQAHWTRRIESNKLQNRGDVT